MHSNRNRGRCVRRQREGKKGRGVELRVGTMAAKGKADMMERRMVNFDFGHQDD